MSFQATPARSSRITKSYRRSSSSLSSMGLKRTTASPSKARASAASPTKKPQEPPSESPKPTYEEYDGPLGDTGVIASLASNLSFRDIPQYLLHIRSSMFSPIPEKGAGMNSTRIADVLNYRKNLPPIVTVAHIDALSPSSTKTEREINELAQAGIVRRVTVPQRGVGSAAVGDGIALVEDWVKIAQESAFLDEGVKEKYVGLMKANPTSTTIPGSAFTSQELSALTGAGFLTTPTITSGPSSLFFAPPVSSGTGGLVTAGSRHASGSLGAVGGMEAPVLPIDSKRNGQSTVYNFSLPNTGAHIKLLLEARNHLITLLKKANPKFKEAPMDGLRERWDGGISSTGEERTEKKKARGEFAGVLPGRTKKWKQFWGLRFEWVLEECVGAGLVECFETGSVGVGVRVV